MQLTDRQHQILDFIRNQQHVNGQSPSLREIADHFGFRSVTAASDHVQALIRKGALKHNESRKARSWQVVSPLQELQHLVVNIPIYGTIPAGYSEEQHQQADGCISVDVESLGIRPTARTFALKVRGDSMIEKHILDGDYVIFEHGIAPKSGDVVAALIDNESTIKTFLINRSKPWLRAENPKYPKLIPATELVVQGVMIALIRRNR